MTAETLTAASVEVGQPATAAKIWRYLRHTNAGFWRSPIAAFFTIVFPLLFLVLLGSLTGNTVIPGTNGVRVAQYLTPAIAAFAATTASFTSLAIGLVIEREEGVLKRVRGVPLDPWMFMVSRVGSTVWIALVSVALMLAVGVLFFDVQLIPRTAPAALLTIMVGIGCFAALGLAVVALSPSQSATQAIANAVIIPLAFISDIFFQGELTGWLDTVGSLFPLKHFANALQQTFDPFLDGPQFGWDHLAVMTAWGAVGAAVALWRFRWEPGPAGQARHGRPDRATTGAIVAADTAPGPANAAQARGAYGTVGLRPVERQDRPGVVAMAWQQSRYAFVAFLRNPASAFFVVAFPVLLLLLLPVVFGSAELPSRGGIQLTQLLAPVLAVFGAASAAYSDFSQRVAFARDRGILKRIHGTPLPVWAFVAGRIGSAVAVALLALVLTVGVGLVVWGVELVPRALPGLLTSVVVGIACFAALGLAIAAVAPNAEAVPAIANATLLPLSFFSDIFIIGDDLPRWMEIVGGIFPLKHFANAVADGMNPTVPGAGFFPDHLAVMVLWLLIGLLVVARFWTWVPRDHTRRRSSAKPLS